ncbi:hypothetical protein CD351_15180 [Erythrobacter sp. KY5]|uniref:hypothetical protein n=1 Tax=Erythrobacter sp. KY5 TaxID=2011159 RepID=UPI000DBF2F90|nr:hypothetical protein [Erythrobacter sp. KY5]AWW75774.1 hypothetical protein CD351_15180 [Erythrobacter sp. KY5]
MGFMGFGRKTFGRKGLAPLEPEKPKTGRIFGNRPSRGGGGGGGGSPFERFFADARDMVSNSSYPASGCGKALDLLTPEERGDLLADIVMGQGHHGNFKHDASGAELIAQHGLSTMWQKEIEVRKEHLPALLTLLIRNKDYRTRYYYSSQFETLLKLINSAIKQGGYLSSGDCEDIAEMASEIRQGRSTYRKADTKKMILRAERLEKLAGVEVSATEFLMERCEGAENEFAIPDKERPNAQFWADLLAEVAANLNDIRLATKGSKRAAWASSEAAFNAQWPACGDVRPSYADWKASGQPVADLKANNGRRNGWADTESYRTLPGTIAGAVAHSRYDWSMSQIPGLDVLADLENPAWTALVEHLITQRRATKATKTWQKEAIELCKPLGIETVEAKLHEWLALFHSPALGRANYTAVVNGDRFAYTIDRLEEAHGDWPQRHADEVEALGKAIAICAASGGKHGLDYSLGCKLVLTDDHSYKNKTATTGVLDLPKPSYKHADGRTAYKSLSSFMRLSVENEEFVRGALWLVALMPDRARAIEALELTALSAATYLWTGEDAMRSKIIANAAIATLIAMGGDDVDAPVLRLSKLVEHRTIQAPLLKHLNAES